MSSLMEQREIVSRQRKPPAREDDADPRIVYFVRSDNRTVEIGSSEDWWIISEQMNQPARDQMEIWAIDRLEGDAAYKLFPLRSDASEQAYGAASDLIESKILAAMPESSIDEEPFAPEYHGDYTIREAREDFELVYRKAMGQVPAPCRPEGPVERGEAA